MNRLMKYGIPIVALVGVMSGCQPSTTASNTDGSPFVHSEHGGQPNLVVTPDDDLLLSWVEYINDTTDALLLSRLQSNSWSTPTEIVRGTDWFVNWADFPSLVAFPDGQSLAAHWLQKSAAGTYDYDVRIAISKDSGNTWSPSFIPHTDGVSAEHGFVSMIPVDSNRVLAVWLDGRNMKTGEGHGGHDHGDGAMTLRAAEFDVNGNLFAESELDSMVCECCQTDAAMTSSGPVVVYRDRDTSEIRDISIVRRVEGRWTSPKHVHHDGWEIAGCPVNGPAVAAHGQQVVVAWFSAPEGEAQVNVVFSEDAGASFGDPLRIDDGRPIGRVDIELEADKTAVVTWVENTGEVGELRMRSIGIDGRLDPGRTLSEMSTSRRSGFPILARARGNLHVAQTRLTEHGMSVMVSRITD